MSCQQCKEETYQTVGKIERKSFETENCGPLVGFGNAIEVVAGEKRDQHHGDKNKSHRQETPVGKKAGKSHQS